VDNTERAQWLARWQTEEQEPFTGWDFAYLAGRLYEEQPPWDYLARAAARMDQATAVLDMDTGGGEKLLSLRSHWPAKVVVTESYPPNLALVRSRLEPLGVTVVDAELSETDPLPFADGEFDLVLNRHGSFNSAEVARILRPGGVFLTQQVHGLWAEALQARFGVKPPWPDATPERDVPLLTAAGLEVTDVQEWQGPFIFHDVGALVYFLKAAPWEVPEFSVARYADVLLEMQAQLDRGEPLAFRMWLYIIEARKPGGQG
jgi:SAM-dependent methyltransferase